jgi:hypothetical protein
LWLLPHDAQEVCHNALAVLRDDALRVELHALDVRVPAATAPECLGSCNDNNSNASSQIAVLCDDAVRVELHTLDVRVPADRGTRNTNSH